MDKAFYGTLKKFFSAMGSDAVFFAAVGILTFIFLAEFIISFFVCGSLKKGKIRLVLFLLGVTFFESAALLAAEGASAIILVYPLMTLSYGSFLSAAVFIFGGRRKRKKEQKELIKLIDDEIKKPIQTVPNESDKAKNFYKDILKAVNSVDSVKDPSAKNAREEERPERIKCGQDEPETKAEGEINFTHVKNVLERLSCYNLSATEKRQIKELQFSVYEAENGGDTEANRIAINDGLGAVLKIMAKYGA